MSVIDAPNVVDDAPTGGHTVTVVCRCYALNLIGRRRGDVAQVEVEIVCGDGEPQLTAWDCADDASEAEGPCPVCADQLAVVGVR